MNGFYKNNPKIQTKDSFGGVGIVGTHNAGGTRISEEEAMSISAVAASADIIASTIARLPIQIYRTDEKGEVNTLEDDRRQFLLNKEPNNLMNGINFKKRIVMDYLFYGSSYLYPEWNRNELIGLYHIDADKVNIKEYSRNDKPFLTDGVIEIMGPDGRVSVELAPEELIIVLKNTRDGLKSDGILKLNSDLLELALRQQSYSSSLLENGSVPLSILEVPTKLTEKAIKNIKDSWVGNYGGSGNAGKTVILEDGVNYKPVSLNPNELELTSSKKTTLSDIARIFNIPESMINSDSNKYNSNEQNNIHLLQYTLSPIISAIENAFERSILLESEKKQGFKIKINTDDILVTTEREKIQSTIEALKGGIININEARRRHGYKEIKDSYFMWSIGAVMYNEETRIMTLPNMGQSLDPNDMDILNGFNNKQPVEEKKIDEKIEVVHKDDQDDKTEVEQEVESNE